MSENYSAGVDRETLLKNLEVMVRSAGSSNGVLGRDLRGP